MSHLENKKQNHTNRQSRVPPRSTCSTGLSGSIRTFRTSPNVSPQIFRQSLPTVLLAYEVSLLDSYKQAFTTTAACCVPRTSVLNSQPIILRLHVYNTRSRCLRIHTYHTTPGRDLLCCCSRLQRKCVTHDATVSSNDAYLRHDPSIK